MNDTKELPVIDGEVWACAWCGVRLHADGLPPVRVHGKRFHTVCVRAWAYDQDPR